LYKCTKEYAPESDRGIIWNDPDIQIRWPLDDPVLSDKDKRHPFLKDSGNTFEYLPGSSDAGKQEKVGGV
jgi:dTDP-4-dehydrorhamnose 3,5-epimerase